MAENTALFVSDTSDILRHTRRIVAAYVGKNHVSAADMPGVLKSIHNALAGLSSSAPAAVSNQKPAVPIKKSIAPGYLVCLEDGTKLKMLKRYLRTRYGLTPEAYRIKWDLPSDYPMVCSNYATTRSEFAKKIGLGRTSKAEVKNCKRA
jgi:predicted transcriptional regulator